ncbi:MAG: pantoate--beta-alanine ligase [Akkermansiaceae bacterium]|nr:pantoate--beta-alanine ligase [Akkermansiaceae bacterium]
MHQFDTAAALRAARCRWPEPVVLVPTMGALHDGHRALVAEARRAAGDGGTVVVSIFINPLQFDRREDLDRYPRDLEADLASCRALGVDAVFTPAAGDFYAPDHSTTVRESLLTTHLCGATRPGHFDGVCTVVLKLFQGVAPTHAIFGKKDYQQLAVIRRMVRDLSLPVEILGGETVREPDGLALSSRNRYLDKDQREQAGALSAALLAGKYAAAGGAEAALDAARAVLDEVPALEVDYLQVRDPMLGPAPAEGQARLLVAARLGRTRLIDNIAIDVGASAGIDGHPRVGNDQNHELPWRN